MFNLQREFQMTLIEENLIAALKDLYDSSKKMTSGHLYSAEDMERYHLALARSERVMKSTGEGK